MRVVCAAGIASTIGTSASWVEFLQIGELPLIVRGLTDRGYIRIILGSVSLKGVGIRRHD